MASKTLKSALLAASLLTPFLAVATASADTVEDVVRQALATNPRMSVFMANRESIDYELRRARGMYLPQIDASAGIGVQRSENFRTQAAGTNKEFHRRNEMALNLTQRLFDGMEGAGEIKKQRARARSAARRVFENAEVLGLDAIVVFLEIYRQRELLRLAEDNLAAHLSILDDLRVLQERGGGDEADLSQAEARRARSRATLYQTQNDLRDAEASYKRIVGEAPKDIELPTLDESVIPATWEDALDLANNGNPTTKIFEEEINIPRADVLIAESNMYPKINLEASWSELRGNDGILTRSNDYIMMIRMRWNLYRGGSDLADTRAALARIVQARNRRYEAANGAVEDMRVSWNAYEISKDRARVLGEAVGHNERTLASYKEQFTQAGRRTLLDVLDAENELFTTRGQLISAEINVLTASYRILGAGGRLLATLGVEAPKQGNPSTPSFSEHVLPTGWSQPREGG